MSTPKQKELQEYFNTLAKKPFISQLRTKALISSAGDRNEKHNLIKSLVVGDSNGVAIETEMELEEDLFLVVKSSQFSDGRYFSCDLVNIKEKNVGRLNDEYFKTKEEAIMAAMIVKLGGNHNVVHGVHLMIKGCNQSK